MTDPTPLNKYGYRLDLYNSIGLNRDQNVVPPEVLREFVPQVMHAKTAADALALIEFKRTQVQESVARHTNFGTYRSKHYVKIGDVWAMP